MLETIITDHKLRIWKFSKQLRRCLNAVCADHHGDLAFLKNEQGLISHFMRQALRVDKFKRLVLSTIPPRDNAHFVSLIKEPLNNGQGQWRFTTTASNHVANHNDRCIDAVTFEQARCIQALIHEKRKSVQTLDGPQQISHGTG